MNDVIGMRLMNSWNPDEQNLAAAYVEPYLKPTRTFNMKMGEGLIFKWLTATAFGI